MTEMEWFGWALVFATGCCMAVWLVLAGCILFSVYEWGKHRYDRRN